MKSTGKVVFTAGLLLSLAAGWLVFPRVLYERREQPVQFSHKTHAGEKGGMSCEDCHAFRPDGSFVGIPSVEQCTGCHAEPVGQTVDEKILVERYVKPGKEIDWLVYARQPDNVSFSHAGHVKLAGLKCESCHGPHGITDRLRPHERNRISGYSRDIWGRSISGIRTAAWDGMKMDDCLRCHREHKSAETACLDCHK